MSGEQELKAAEAELAEAERDLAKAERDIESAEEKIEEIIDRDRPFRVDVIYNGVPRPFEVRHNEVVKSLLDKALAAFGPITNPHTYAIYKGARELLNDETLEQAEVKPHDKLLLRPSEIRGGTA